MKTTYWLTSSNDVIANTNSLKSSFAVNLLSSSMPSLKAHRLDESGEGFFGKLTEFTLNVRKDDRITDYL